MTPMTSRFDPSSFLGSVLMMFERFTRRLALAAPFSVAFSMSACSLWGPTLPPSTEIVTQIDKEVAPSNRDSAEFDECNERFRNKIKGGHPNATKDNGMELMLFDVVSVYLTRSTVDPFTCRIKSVIITEKMRDIDNNGVFAFYDVLGAVRQINRQPNEKSEPFLLSSDVAENYSHKLIGDMLRCKSGDENVSRVETNNAIIYCHDAGYEAITYGLIFKGGAAE
jgi:hypothetical protein